MGKAPLILQYLHDHARLVCDRRNEKDGPGTWRIIPVPDDQRRNIIFHYGTSENFHDFFNDKPVTHKDTTELESPTLNYCEINLKSLERREMMRMTERKVSTKARLTLKPKAKGGIFSNGIHANTRILVQNNEENADNIVNINTLDTVNVNDTTLDTNYTYNTRPDTGLPSTSSIYIDSSDDFEGDLLNEPEDLVQAHLQHQKDLYSNAGDWFNETANFTQSQPKGFIPRHRDFYRFNSQK